MRKLIIAMVAVLAAVSPAFATETYIAHLSSAKTGTNSPATGTAIFILADDLASIDYNVSYTTLVGTQTGCHVHQIGHGIVFDLGTGFNPMIGTWMFPLPAQITALRTAQLYINVHSDVFPSGEIQGTLLPDNPNPVAGSTWGKIKALYAR
jgi:CHRD domain